MKLFAGIVVLASCMPYLVCGDSAAAAAATFSGDGAAAAAASTTCSEPQYPPMRCSCPTIYEPVCGTDGITYTNKCWLACANHKVAYTGACSNLPCKCQNLIVPVCGTDGKTYRNACIMRCLNADQKPPVYVAEPGACKIEKCFCSKQKDEICATDKKTYYNRCFLNCQNRRLDQLGEKRLTIKHNGPCSLCGCPKILDPVCANNDVTYPNECLFRCDNNSCEKKLFIRWKGDCNCGCTNKYDPYCTPEGRTIPNGCLVNCENRKRYQDGIKPLIVTRGECKRCRCDYCPLVEQPVCDENGKIYRNMCFFNCNNDCRQKAGLNKLCTGKCRFPY